MNISFIGFGKVSYTLSKLIQSPDINLTTSSENRSDDTVDLIKKSNVEVSPSYSEAIENSDVIISAVTPSKALEVAKKCCNTNALYLDLNNISPNTALKINDIVNNFVDGSIIGKIDAENPILYLSGKDSDKLLFLNDYLDVRIISDNVGDASKLKLLRSTYTKSLSALLIECYSLASSLNLEEEFFNTLSLTEGNNFKNKSLSRINNTLKSSNRKAEELEEILEYFGDEDLGMVKAALDKLKRF